MKLHEISISQDVKQSNANWQEIAAKYGWKVLGVGAEATVVSKPDVPYVLKIFPAGSSYNAFVKLCRDHLNDPHLPKFSRKTQKLQGSQPPMNYVRMEPLQAISENELFFAFMPEITYLYLELQKRGLEMHWNFHSSVRQRLERAYKVHPNKAAKLLTGFFARREMWKTIGQPPQDWMATVNLLVRFLPTLGQKTRFDLHADNFMLRQNTLVLTDPFVGKLSYAPT